MSHTPSASGSYVWQAGRQADEILVDLKILKFSTDCIGWIFAVFNEGAVLLYCYQCISVSFLGKVYCECVIEAHKSGTPCFLCRSLLLSTTVLNDVKDHVQIESVDNAD